MSNPHKGEVTFEAAGVTYTLCFSIDSICAMEEKMGKGLPQIHVEMSERPSVALLRGLLWGGLREHHADITLKAAGDLIVSGGGFDHLTTLVGEGFSRAFPKPESGDANPPKPGQ